MADAPGTDRAADPGQLSAEELRAYLAQLRRADVAEVIAQAFSILASGAEVKLGRRDGRLLIDAASALAEAVGPQLDRQLADQLNQAITQLRVGQVDAEKQLAQLRAEGKLPEQEQGDLPETAAASERPAEEERPAAASRLWLPGR